MRREQVFWGWGEPGAGPSLPAHASEWLRSELGVSGERVDHPVALEDVRLRPPALPAGLRERLAGIAGADAVRDDREARVLRCRGKSYLDLLAQRAGACEDAPDAVVAPGDHDQVRAVLGACAEAGVAVVPFGGGTSVVGGLEPQRGGFDAVVSLDLGRMDRLLGVDERSLTAVFEPGVRLPEADRALGRHGFTLGHVPQSYEWATVGGCVATRSAGQSSTGHGRIDDNVVAVRCVAPAGELETLDVPATAAGPALRELVVGSEGALGVITRVALRVRPASPARRHDAWLAPSFAEGCEALRRIEQAGAAPDVARLSDEPETRVGLALAGGAAARAGRAVLKARPGACLLVLGWEDGAELTAVRRRTASRLSARRGSVARSDAVRVRPGPRRASPGRTCATTCSTAACSSRRSRRRRRGRGSRPCTGRWAPRCAARSATRSWSATSRTSIRRGASLYFTVLAARDAADPVGQWRRAKAAACDAIVAGGGTITHHHAVGRDHAPWLGAEAGPFGLELLRAAKERCDPAGIMNPGVLLAR